MTTNPELNQLGRLVGTWTTQATHPAVPGVVVRGTVEFAWLEGERFLIQRARTDHADFPGFMAVLGVTDKDRVDPGASETTGADESAMTMHYFDSRGVFRVYDVSIDGEALRIWRNAPGFSQRFTGTFADGGDTIAGTWQLCRDDVNWNDHLAITYRRRKTG
jgi:hypothetical protein